MRSGEFLHMLTAGGFFTDAPDSDYALAIIDGAFTKALVIQLARKVCNAAKPRLPAQPGQHMKSMVASIVQRCSRA